MRSDFVDRKQDMKQATVSVQQLSVGDHVSNNFFIHYPLARRASRRTATTANAHVLFPSTHLSTPTRTLRRHTNTPDSLDLSISLTSIFTVNWKIKLTSKHDDRQSSFFISVCNLFLFLFVNTPFWCHWRLKKKKKEQKR